MEPNENLKAEILKIINNQMKNNDPPETNKTYNRLIDQGYNDSEARELIGLCLAVELFNTLKHKKPYDENRYIRNLTNLPKEPDE